MIHMGDLVRHKGDYKNFDISKRKDIFNAIFHLTRKIPININSFIINKKYTSSNDIAFSNIINYNHIVEFDKTQERLFQITDMLTFIYKYYYNFKNKQYLSKNERTFWEATEMRKLLNHLKKKKL